MAPLRSRVWQRHGQLRLYISGDGLDVGWCDPRTGRFELHQPTLEPEFWQAVHAGCDQLLRDGCLREAVIHRPVPPTVTARPLAELVAPADPPGAARELGAAPVPDERWVVRDPRWDDLASTHLVRRPGPGRGSCGRSTPCW
jgi:DNA-binding transcriptional LysR family regulator